MVALFACWLIMPLGPLSWIGATTPFILALTCWRKNRKWAIFLSVANPLAVVAILAGTSYFRGTAALHFHGLPGLQSHNLDRETRLPKRGGGCVVNGSEWLGDGWHNLVLRACSGIIGPMRGSPSGEYPDESALTGAWSDAEWVQVADLRRGVISLGGRSRVVPHASRLLDALAPSARDEQAMPPDPQWDDEWAVRIQAKAFGGESFAVRIGCRDFQDRRVETTVLFGGNPPEIMGYFAPRGAAPSRRYAPVRPGS